MDLLSGSEGVLKQISGQILMLSRAAWSAKLKRAVTTLRPQEHPVLVNNLRITFGTYKCHHLLPTLPGCSLLLLLRGGKK